MSYGIYIAKVVGRMVDGDDRVQVRILPQMNDDVGIPDNRCPKWPYFFRDEFISGTNSRNELVWVICNNDFSVGYVLGPANYTTYSSDSSLFKDASVPSDLKDIASETLVNLKAQELSFNNIKVTYWNNDCIHFIERASGGSIIAYRNGSIYVARKDEFMIKIGDCKFMINSSGVSFSGPNINLGSDKVCIGNKSDGRILVTSGEKNDNARASECAWA